MGTAGGKSGGASCCPPEWAGGDAGWDYIQHRKGSPATFSIQPNKASSSQPPIPDPSACFACWKLETGGVRWEEGGGVWKTNCSSTSGLWVLQAVEMERSHFQLQIGKQVLNVSCGAPENRAACRDTSSGRWDAARQGAG